MDKLFKNWKASGYDFPVYVMAGDVMIAEIRCWGFLISRLSEAEAIEMQVKLSNLITAAPYLLAACEKALGVINKFDIDSSIFDELVSAIGKAKNE